MKYLANPYRLFLFHSGSGRHNNMSDEKYLRKAYRAIFGKKLNLDDPKTFNEKIQWLKLYDRKPIYTTMVDKCEAKKYVAAIIGEEHIIPTLGVWDKFEDIDFDALPGQFVLKTTHDSGGIVICRDKKTFDKEKARQKIELSLKKEYFYLWREWPYKDVKPRIIAEEYMEDAKTAELRDYKFYCFGGAAKVLLVASERQKQNGGVKFDFFDMEFKHLDLRKGHGYAAVCPEKPENFEKMQQFAEKLSQDIPFLRVDFYEVNGKVYFGELTFSPSAGMVPFEPKEWDDILGSWIELPMK